MTGIELTQAQARIRELEARVHDRAHCALCGETFTTSPYAEAVERAETAEARIRELEGELVQVRDEFAAVAADYVDYKCSEGGPSSVDTNDLPDDEPTRALVLGRLSEGTWADLMPGLRDVLEARRAAGKGERYEQRLEKVLNAKELCTPEERRVLEAMAEVEEVELQIVIEDHSQTGTFESIRRACVRELSRRAAGKGAG